MNKQEIEKVITDMLSEPRFSELKNHANQDTIDIMTNIGLMYQSAFLAVWNSPIFEGKENLKCEPK